MVGDEILLLVSRLMSHTFRGSDLLYRYGGEEFVVVLPGNAGPRALEIAERVRQRIGSQRVRYSGREISMTASIGVFTG